MAIVHRALRDVKVFIRMRKRLFVLPNSHPTSPSLRLNNYISAKRGNLVCNFIDLWWETNHSRLSPSSALSRPADYLPTDRHRDMLVLYLQTTKLCYTVTENSHGLLPKDYKTTNK